MLGQNNVHLVSRHGQNTDRSDKSPRPPESHELEIEVEDHSRLVRRNHTRNEVTKFGKRTERRHRRQQIVVIKNIDYCVYFIFVVTPS